MLDRSGLAPTRIAEVGCGAGGILEALRERLDPSPVCVGYEISPQAFAMAKKREVDGLAFKLGSPSDDPSSYDLVLAMDVLEHVEDYLGFIRSLKPVARWQMLHIPLDLSIVSLANPLYLQMAREHVGHLHYFTLETALASLEQAGLLVKDWFYTSVELDQGAPGRKRLHRLRKLIYRYQPHWVVRWLGGFSVLVLTEANASGEAKGMQDHASLGI